MKSRMVYQITNIGAGASGWLPLIVLLTVVCAVFAAPASAQAADPMPAGLEAKILAEDWQGVVALLEHVTPETPSPVLRLIKGHACLSLNRNNESLCLFLSLASEKAIQACAAWSEDLVRGNPDGVAARYLHGDVLARQKQWDGALAEFTKALDAQHGRPHALVLNARGVVHAAQGRLDDAFDDYLAASAASDKFADAMANLGAVAIQRKEGARGALADFNRCIDVAPDFGLALYGRGCVRMVLGDAEGGAADFDAALSKSGCGRDLILAFVYGVRERLAGHGRITTAEVSDDENPGMEVDSAVRAMKSGDLGFFGDTYKKGLGTALQSGNQDLVNKMSAATSNLLNTRPELSPYISKYNNQVKTGFENTLRMDKVVEHHTGAFVGKANVNLGPLKKVGVDIESQLGGPREIHKNFAQDHSGATRGLKSIGGFETGLMNTSPGFKNHAGGFKTGVEEASWDDGNWPFEPYYGLLYTDAAALSGSVALNAKQEH